MASQTVILITGSSTGFGKEMTKAALARGYKVIAASRSITSASMKELEEAGAALLQLDPSSPPATLKDIIQNKAIPIYGQIDVLINNAAFLMDGVVEESTLEEIEAMYRVNVFAPIQITNALLPHLRAKRQGLIVHISSIGAHLSGPTSTLYCSTKAAISSLSDGQRAEVAPLGIEVVSLEPGFFRTALLSNLAKSAGQIDTSRIIHDYDSFINRTHYGNLSGKQRGDPVKGARATIDEVVGRWVKSGKKVGSLTKRIPLGADAHGFIADQAQVIIDGVKKWEGITDQTDVDGEKPIPGLGN